MTLHNSKDGAAFEGEDPEITFEKLAMMRKVWNDVFHSAPPNDAVLQHMAKEKDLEGLRAFFYELKGGLLTKEESNGIDVADITLFWKGAGEIEAMEEENSCSIPKVNVFKFNEEDIRRSVAEGSDLDFFNIVLSHRIKQKDDTYADAMMNVDGHVIKEEDQNDYNSALTSKLVALQDQIMNGEVHWDQKVIPVDKDNKKWGPVLMTDQKNSQMLTWLLVPAFVDDLRDYVKKHSYDEVNNTKEKFELVVFPISKRVLIACNAYDHLSCLMMSRLSQDPGLSGNSWERLRSSIPMIVARDEMRGAEDLDENDLLSMVQDGLLPVTYAPYPLRTSCLLVGEIAEGRGLIAPRLSWGSNLMVNNTIIRGNCCECGQLRSSLISCVKCWRMAYCNEDCLRSHLPKHEKVCLREFESLQLWREIVRDHKKTSKISKIDQLNDDANKNTDKEFISKTAVTGPKLSSSNDNNDLPPSEGKNNNVSRHHPHHHHVNKDGSKCCKGTTLNETTDQCCKGTTLNETTDQKIQGVTKSDKDSSHLSTQSIVNEAKILKKNIVDTTTMADASEEFETPVLRMQ